MAGVDAETARAGLVVKTGSWRQETAGRSTPAVLAAAGYVKTRCGRMSIARAASVWRVVWV